MYKAIKYIKSDIYRLHGDKISFRKFLKEFFFNSDSDIKFGLDSLIFDPMFILGRVFVLLVM